jgi:signal transduction histidine kinase
LIKTAKLNLYWFLPFVIIIVLMITMISSCTKAEDDTLSLEESNSRVAVAAVHVAAEGLGGILNNIDDENHRIQTIRKFIDPIRFFSDVSGYFYVYDYDCVNIAHAVDKTLPGKDLSNYTDMKGLFVIQELSTAAKNGGGFVNYYWVHPETKEEQRKVGYVKPIPGTDYFIGTGYYPDTK